MTKDQYGYKVNTIIVPIMSNHKETANLVATAIKENLPVRALKSSDETSTAVQFEGAEYGVLFSTHSMSTLSGFPSKYDADYDKWRNMGRSNDPIGVLIGREIDNDDVKLIRTAVMRAHRLAAKR